MCNIQNTEISITLVHGQNRFLIDAYFVVDIEELGGVTSRLFHWVWSPMGLPPPLPSSFPENAFRMFWVVPPALRSTIVFWESLLFTLQFGVCALYEYILRNSTFTTAHLNIALREAVKNYLADFFPMIGYFVLHCSASVPCALCLKWGLEVIFHAPLPSPNSFPFSPSSFYCSGFSLFVSFLLPNFLLEVVASLFLNLYLWK